MNLCRCLSWLVVIFGVASVTQRVQGADTRGLNCINAVSGYYCDSVSKTSPSKGYFYMHCPKRSSKPTKFPLFCEGKKVCLQVDEKKKECVEVHEFFLAHHNRKKNKPTTPPPKPKPKVFNCRDYKSGSSYCKSAGVYVRVFCKYRYENPLILTFKCPDNTRCDQVSTTKSECVKASGRATVPTKPAPRPTPATTAPPPEFDCSKIKSGFYCLNNEEFVRVVCSETDKTARAATYKFPCRPKGRTRCVQSSSNGIQCLHKSSGGTKPSGGNSGKPLPTKTPGKPTNSLVKIPKDKRPMFVYFSIDDGITPDVYDWSLQLFKNRKNPNNCRVTATYNVVQVNTVFKLLKKLHNDYGHEINSHGTTHRSPSTWWRKASKADWEDEIVGITRIVEEKTGISSTELRGMRAPFLEIGGNHVFEMLAGNGFKYDTSMVPSTKKLYWPYMITNMKDHPGRCNNVHGCPTKDFPTLWEMPLNKYYNCPLRGFEKAGFAMLDQCRPENKKDALHYLKKNFYRFYRNGKVPFGLNMHFAWFASKKHNLEAMKEFLDEIQQLSDVWIVSAYKIIQWMENQKTHDDMKKGKFSPVNC